MLVNLTRFRLASLLAALGVVFAALAVGAQPKSLDGDAEELREAADAMADGSGEESAAAEGSADPGASRTELRFAPAAEGSGEAEPEPPEESAAEDVAAHVVAQAAALPRRVRDPRVALLRAGGAEAEIAEVLGVELIELTSQESVSRILDELRLRRISLGADRELASSQVSTLAARANFLFDELQRVGEPRPFAAFQLLAAQEMVGSASSDRDVLDAEIAFTDEAVEYVIRRMQVLATEVSAEVSSELAAASTEIEAERVRLEQEEVITDALAEQAREAGELARQELEEARNELEVEIAIRRGEASSALETITSQRTGEQATIEEITARRQTFAAIQIDHSGMLSAILDEPNSGLRAEGADELLEVLIAERAEVRETAHRRRERMRELELAVAQRRDELAQKDRELRSDELAEEHPELAIRLAEVGQLELSVFEEALAVAVFRAENAASRWRLNEAQINFYARTIDQLVPQLSRERRRSLFALNADNLNEARLNLAERIIGVRLAWREATGAESFIESVEKGGRLQRLLLQLGGVLLIFLAVRAIPRQRDVLVVRVIALRQRPRLRRLGPSILKAGEVLHESIVELSLVIGFQVAIWILPQTPSVRLVMAWLWWTAAYRFVMRVTEVLALPREARPAVMIGEPPDDVRLGVDLVSWGEATGRLVVRSVRAVLVYFVAAKLGLAAIRYLFGPGFVFYWCQWLATAALAVLVYAMAWYWRKEIVDEFCQRVGDRADSLAEWLTAHQSRFYSVVIVVLLGTYLVVAWASGTVARWVTGRGIGAFLTNFAVRKRLERAAVGGKNGAEAALVLPEPYRRVFRDKPLEIGLIQVRCDEVSGENCAFPTQLTELSAGEKSEASALEDGAAPDRVATLPLVSAIGEAQDQETAAPRRTSCPTPPAESWTCARDGQKNVLVERPREMKALRAAFDSWLIEKGHGTVAILGDPGSGKTTFALAAAKSLESLGHDVTTSAIRKRLLSKEDVYSWLATNLRLNFGSAPTRSSIVSTLSRGKPRVVVVDRCEKLFLRTVGGFEGVDEFLELSTLTNHRVFWILVFDSFPWDYLHRVRDRRGFFRETVRLRPFDDGQLKALIERRNEAAGIFPDFDRLTGSEDRSDQYFEVVKTSAGYYRLLAEYSRGNLRVALHFWLRSLVMEDDGKVHVSLFRRPDAKQLRTLGDDLLFALTAIAQHRALSVDELAEILDLERGEVEVTVNLLRETGYIEHARSGRLRIAVRMFFPVLNRLREENFLHLD